MGQWCGLHLRYLAWPALDNVPRAHAVNEKAQFQNVMHKLLCYEMLEQLQGLSNRNERFRFLLAVSPPRPTSVYTIRTVQRMKSIIVQNYAR